MKKLLAIMGLAAVATSSLQAQGLVIFGNGSTSRVSTNSVAGGAAAGLTSATAGGFYYALFYSTTAANVGGSTAATNGASASGYVFNAANSASWTQVTSLATNTTAGRFLGSASDANSATAVNGLAGGTAANFVVVGWSANLGTSVAGMMNTLALANWSGTAFLGESVVSGSLTAGNGGLVPTPALFGSSAPAMQAFTLGVVVPTPEPSTMALAGLGSAALLLFRRRNK